MSQQKKQQQLFTLILEYPSGYTKSVQVRATTEQVAKHRALKRNPEAVKVYVQS
jgi:hypothetical protein